MIRTHISRILAAVPRGLGVLLGALALCAVIAVPAGWILIVVDLLGGA